MNGGLIWVRLEEMLGRCLRIVTACSDAPSSFLLEMAPASLPAAPVPGFGTTLRGNQAPLHPCKSNQLPTQIMAVVTCRPRSLGHQIHCGSAVLGWRSLGSPPWRVQGIKVQQVLKLQQQLGQAAASLTAPQEKAAFSLVIRFTKTTQNRHDPSPDPPQHTALYRSRDEDTVLQLPEK